MASLVRSTATIGFYTLVSRVFGFVRDMLQAALIGANGYSDAFFIAFKLPNFFRRIFAEGAFNAAFVPLYAGTLAEDGKDAATRFASDVFAVLLITLLGLTALMLVIMPWFMLLLAPGFHDDPETFTLATHLTRLTFPYLLFISLVTLLGGILNSIERFAAVAATPVLMNLCFIASLGLVWWMKPGAEEAVTILAIGVTISGLCQFLWLVAFCRRAGVLPRLVRPRLTPAVRKLLRVMGPAVLGGSVAQINLMMDVILASFLPLQGAISYLYYADRINELPLAVIGIAISVALLPLLSKQVRTGEREKATHTQNRAIEFALLLALPAALGIIMLAHPLIALLYERGAFTATDTARAAPALMAFAAGLPAFVLIKVLAPGFYAHQDTKTPFLIASSCILLNFCLNLLLMGPMQHVGMALATSIAGWVNAFLMARVLVKRNLWQADSGLKHRLPRLLLATLGMVGVLYGIETALPATAYAIPAWLHTFTLIGMGLGSYGLLALILGAVDRARLKKYMRPKG